MEVEWEGISAIRELGLEAWTLTVGSSIPARGPQTAAKHGAFRLQARP